MTVSKRENGDENRLTIGFRADRDYWRMREEGRRGEKLKWELGWFSNEQRGPVYIRA